MVKSVFDMIAEADSFQTTPRIPVGNHVLKVTRVLEKTSKKNETENLYIVEFECVSSDNPAFAPGSPCGWMQKSSWTGWKGRVRGTLEAVAGGPLDGKQIAAAFSESNPFMDATVKAVGTKTGKAAKDGSEIVNVSFFAHEAA